jgi:hypothetical protein
VSREGVESGLAPVYLARAPRVAPEAAAGSVGGCRPRSRAQFVAPRRRAPLARRLDVEAWVVRGQCLVGAKLLPTCGELHLGPLVIRWWRHG